jgi:cell division protein FtsB
MDSFKVKINGYKKKLHQKGLYDVRLLALALIGVIAISVFWNGSKIVQQNYELSQKVATIQKQNEVLELENRNKELRNRYLSTDEFAELTARRVLGRAAPGERVYIVPKEVALASLTEKQQENDELQSIEVPSYQRNFKAWMRIYLQN